MLSDDQMPLYVLSIQERAEQLASQFEGKPVAQEVKSTYRGKFPLLITSKCQKLRSLVVLHE